MISKTYVVLVMAAICAAIAIVGGWLIERVNLPMGPCLTGDRYIGNGMTIHGTWCGKEVDTILAESAARWAAVPQASTVSPVVVGCVVSAGIQILEPDVVQIYGIECQAFAPYSDPNPGVEIIIDSKR